MAFGNHYIGQTNIGALNAWVISVAFNMFLSATAATGGRFENQAVSIKGGKQ